MDIWPREDKPQYTYSEAFRNMHRELEVTKAACRVLEQERDDLAGELDDAKTEARELRDVLGRLHAVLVMLAEATKIDG